MGSRRAVRVLDVYLVVGVISGGVLFVMPCAPTCTTTDVVTGLAQISDQLHGSAAFLFLAALMLLLLVVVQVVLMFALLRAHS